MRTLAGILPDMPLESALLRFPTPSGRDWLAFADPIDSWETDDLAEVADVLRSAETANQAGRWVDPWSIEGG